jgi:acetolactate synthase-1/2/3 large subunit
MSNRNEWIEKCQHWKTKWPVYNQDFKDDTNGINLYEVIETLNDVMQSNDVILTDAGTAYYVIGQNLKLKKNQKLVFPGAQADMGFALPASIGAYLADKDANIISVIGDGSFNTNLQELASIKAVKAKVKFIILNNKGYLSIRNTQKNYFNNNIYGESEKTGLWFPDLKKIADAYEMEYYSVENNSTLKEFFERYLHSDKSIIFDVNCKFWQDVIPTLALKYDSVKNINVQTGLDDMFPFLNDDELN